MQNASVAVESVVKKQSSPKVKPAFPFLDLKAQFDPIKDEIISSVLKTLESQRFILGPEVEAFEAEIAAEVSSAAAIGCASGSDALLLALMALNVGPGDEVITTPFTFVATVGAIVRLRAKPVFVDISPETYNLDPELLKAAVTSRTRAIIPVHLFGASADMASILKSAEETGLPVVEDAAQAIGSTYNGRPVGSIGTIGCFSFFPSKNLGGAGDGGMMTTNDTQLADRLRVLRTHGSRERYSYELVGMNSRLDAIQAAILRVKLRYLDGWAEKRRRNAETYRALISESGLNKYVRVPVEPAYTRHVYNQFTIRVADRDALRSHMSSRGIPTEVYYPSPLHLQPAFSYLGYRAGAFPESERASQEVVSLPIYPELTAEMLRAVVQSVADFYRTA